MQDVHWSAGHLGYFPTYTLGNLYAAQFFARAERDLGDQEAAFARGDFGAAPGVAAGKDPPPGQALPPPGVSPGGDREDPNPQYLVNYLRKKFGELYDLREK